MLISIANLYLIIVFHAVIAISVCLYIRFEMSVGMIFCCTTLCVLELL